MKLTKKQLEQLVEFQDQLRADRNELHRMHGWLVKQLADAVLQINGAVAQHNLRLRAARAFVQDIAAGLRDDYEEKGERWKESEVGQAALAMVEEWENADLDDVEPVSILEPDKPFFEESLNLPEESDV